MSVSAKIPCPHCQQPTTTDSGFCDECGLELATQPLKPVTAAQILATGSLEKRTDCPFCGYKLRPNAKHCSNCGKKLGTRPITEPLPLSMVQQALEEPGVMRVGRVISDRYGLEKILGEGGMGRVWLAYDRNLSKHIVIKTVVAPDESLRAALKKEAQTLINIRHPNIISVLDFFTIENELCYVMEYVPGPSWADEIEEPIARKLVQPLPAEEALRRIKGLLPAFKYLHGLNPPIIYCDFKPSNVKRLTLANGDIVEVLLDFGTAYTYDPKVPPKPARGTPGYHSPQAKHPDWRDDYFTIGRAIAELVGMAEVHTEENQYTLTPADVFPWSSYDESLRYLVEWMTAPERENRPQNVDEILHELDGVIGFVKGQKPDLKAMRRQRQRVSFAGVTLDTIKANAMTGTVTHTIKIDFPEVPAANPAATVLLTAQEAYQQRDYTRALILANQAINNHGGASAYALRAMVYNQQGDLQQAQKDLVMAQRQGDPKAQWEMLMAEGQLHENAGNFEKAADAYRKLMALRPGDYRGRLLLADLYRRSGKAEPAIEEYQAIIQAKPSVGSAYIGASKAYLASKQLDNAIKVLEDVSSRNASYNDVLLELIALYNEKAQIGDVKSLEQAARAIDVLQENGVESRMYFRLRGEFYFTAYQLARKTGAIPKLVYPDGTINTLADLAKMNEAAWRDYLARDDDADRDKIINTRIMAARTWAVI